MNFILLSVTTQAGDLADALKYELSELGFDSFLEEGDTFETSLPEDQFDLQAVEEVLMRYSQLMPLDWTSRSVEKQNWNQLWEQNYPPIIIADTCLIRASFHQADRQYPYEIVITPKMSFGTGHHETTSMMVEHQLELDHRGKKVADFGCGTGVLAIMALKLGAAAADACDIEDWSVENTLENAAVNQVTLTAFTGTAAQLPQQESYDIILANINLNVLTGEMPLYAGLLKPGGCLLLSGFYESDIPQLLERAAQFSLREAGRKVKKNWASLRLYK